LLKEFVSNVCGLSQKGRKEILPSFGAFFWRKRQFSSSKDHSRQPQLERDSCWDEWIKIQLG